MSDINHVTLIGRLTKNPELKYTQAGKSVASFSIANDKTYVANGEKKQQTSFFNCVSWGKLGETISKYCKKGQLKIIRVNRDQALIDNIESEVRLFLEELNEKEQALKIKLEAI
jgi:single-strand DNA-binding protein